jgi:CheY-like chemotaxis protein
MAGDKKNILVIDDEPDEREYLSTFLEDNGYVTSVAGDGNEGLEKAKADPPDLITLDITMPEKSGVKFYREIRKDPELGKIPIVVVTGVTGLGGNPEEFHKFLSTRKETPPPDGFISKPVDQEKLLNTIKKLLA